MGPLILSNAEMCETHAKASEKVSFSWQGWSHSFCPCSRTEVGGHEVLCQRQPSQRSAGLSGTLPHKRGERPDCLGAISLDSHESHLPFGFPFSDGREFAKFNELFGCRTGFYEGGAGTVLWAKLSMRNQQDAKPFLGGSTKGHQQLGDERPM